MPNVGSQTPEMAEEEEVTEVLVLSWLSAMQTRIADLHYAVSQTKIIAPALSGIKIQTLSSPCISKNAGGHLQDLTFPSKVSLILKANDQSFEEVQCSRIDWDAVCVCNMVAVLR